mmetsp:Transcript_136628/g.323689  ORF Transcript_136628/g.323689 Transcript_136628/m.323689 type:complete len:87 (-) Transcript_136628:1156-1416(-)
MGESTLLKAKPDPFSYNSFCRWLPVAASLFLSAFRFWRILNRATPSIFLKTIPKCSSTCRITPISSGEVGRLMTLTAGSTRLIRSM